MNLKKQFVSKINVYIAMFLAGILLSFLIIELNFYHFDLSNDDWRGLVAEQINKQKNEYGKTVNEPEKTYIKYRLMLLEYIYHKGDLQSYEDNLLMIRSHEFLISILCLFFSVIFVKNREMGVNQSPFLSLSSSFLTCILFSLFILIIEPIFALLIGHIFFGFQGFFHPVAVIIDNQVVELSTWKYLLITRSMLMIRLLVICAIGVFIRSVFRNRWLSLSITSIMLPIVLFALWDPGEMERFVFYKYHLHDFFFWEFYSEPLKGTTIWFGLLVHGMYLFLFLLGSWLFCKREHSQTAGEPEEY